MTRAKNKLKALSTLSSQVKALHRDAIKARKLSYSPYSKFAVGAAFVTGSKKVFTGFNVENASYGGTVCAERVAIWGALAQGMPKTKHGISDLVVVAEAPQAIFPCALCLQVMSEFFDRKTRIWLANSRFVHSVYLFSELLPHNFGPEHL